MTDQRIIIEMGMGNDLHGMDYTKAALRAIEDAFRHSSLPLFSSLDLDHATMRVNVTVAVQEPDKLDLAILTSKLPRGQVTVTAVEGGLNVENPENNDTIVIATAAIEAFLPDQSANWQLTKP